MITTMQYSKGRIVDVRKVDQPYGYLVQGEAAKKYRDGYGCTGGNGTYLLWEGSGINHWLYLDVSVYSMQNHKASIDIREMALAANGRARVTEGFIEVLKAALVDKKITVMNGPETQYRWAIADWSELNLVV